MKLLGEFLRLLGLLSIIRVIRVKELRFVWRNLSYQQAGMPVYKINNNDGPQTTAVENSSGHNGGMRENARRAKQGCNTADNTRNMEKSWLQKP